MRIVPAGLNGRRTGFPEGLTVRVGGVTLPLRES